MGRAGGDVINLIAVEVSRPCQCHHLVLARENDAHRWFYFFVKNPTWIEFGSILKYHPAREELFLCRGPNLNYKAILDSMNTEAAELLVRELPYFEIYPDGPAGIEFHPPQG